MQEVRQRVVVVTGASAGVGRATAIAFARTGATVALLARNTGRLEDAAAEVRAVGGRALVLPLDVADAEAVEAAAQRVETELGPIEVWVNNAMVTVYSWFQDMAAEELRRVNDVTYLGAVYGTMAALKRMRPRNRGVIIQVGSALSYCSIPLQSAYCGAKFALRGFTDAVRIELLHQRSDIHITMVHLSAFNTPQFDWSRSRLPLNSKPVSPPFQPEVAARAIVWSADHRRRELWAGFPAVRTIIASKLFPRLVDRVLSRLAIQGQQDESAPPLQKFRPGNLFHTVAGDSGSHGRFEAQAGKNSWQLELSMHRGKVALIVIAFIIAVVRATDWAG